MEIRVSVIISQLFQVIMLACKMYFTYPGVKLVSLEMTRKKRQFLMRYSRLPYNCKTCHFTLRKGRERRRNVQKSKVHVKSVQAIVFQC